MDALSAVASVGAGLSAAHSSYTVRQPPAAKAPVSTEANPAAALILIQSALAATGTGRHDLDVLA